MRLYRSNSESVDILRYGRRLEKGLARFPETAPLAATLATPQSALKAATAATEALQAPLDDASDDLKFAENAAESQVRRLHNRCQELDGDRAGPITKVGFPEGLTVVLVPKGSAQKTAFEDLRAAYNDSGLPAVEPQRAALVALCDAALATFSPAYAAWTAAQERYDRAFATEVLRRGEHRRTVDGIFGGIREAFPRDRRVQDAIVPRVAGASDKDDAEPTPGDSGPGTGGTGAGAPPTV